MEPVEFISVLNKHHADYDCDFVESLSRDHKSDNIFIRFVANVKLKRFFEYVLSRRSEQKTRDSFSDISKMLAQLIIEDWEILHSKEEFKLYRSRLYLDPFYNSVFEDNSRVIRFDEGEFKNLFGSDCWAPYFKNAIREYWRLDQEPRLLESDVWELEDIKKNYALYKEDLQEFQSRPKPIIQQQTPDNTPTEPLEPPKRIWKHQKQYLGYIVGKLIDNNRKIEMEPLAKELAKFFTDENNKPLNYETIRQNMDKWRNRHSEIVDSKKNFGESESVQIIETRRIFEKESKYIQAVIDYFIKTR